ncbi:TPA: hypothetical protein ACUNBO_004329 [Morganella morganii]|uniref:hypothetical protein n=1 Tax=Morganella morganii TaxID=582 RepID=UPI002368A2B6|nr:hypothetical protein [Morganella morganii]
MRYIQNKGNVMKAGIFLREGIFISKNHIVSYSFSDDRVNLNMVNGDIISIEIETDDNKNLGLGTESLVIVPINEYHRIQRELNEYFE